MFFIKKIIFILIIFFTTLSLAQSEEQIVYLDLDKVVSNTKAGKLIINELKKSKKKDLSKFEKKEKELKKIENDINKQKNILSEDELKKKITNFRKEISIFQNNKQKVISEFNQKKIDEFNKFFKKITPLIENYAKEKKIDIVLDRKNIFLASKKKDITQEIIKIIDSSIK
ncbi:MAG: OmpH family outer membrane protein [Candidatus Pelagibacter sp.]